MNIRFKTVSIETVPALKPDRTINIMFDADVTSREKHAVLHGLTRTMNIAHAPRTMKVYDLGVWRAPHWRDAHNQLVEWNSIDWYLAEAARASRSGQLHGGVLMRLLYREPWQHTQPHYDVVVTSRDLYDDDCAYCIGLAIRGFGTVISTARFRSLTVHAAHECIVTETMHEVGHMFGLVPPTRTRNVEYSLGLHCTNRCIMRQGLAVPHDWQVMTVDRLEGHEFCPACCEDLRRHFA